MVPSNQTKLFYPQAKLPLHCAPQDDPSEEANGRTVLFDDAPINGIPNIVMYSGPKAGSVPGIVKLVSHIFNESFGFRPDGKPYRLGPKSVSERLSSTDYLFIAGGEAFGLGYLFGKEIASSSGRIAWIESMAVLPLYRRQGVATTLVKKFHLATKGAYFLGCATPNPIAAYVVTRVVSGHLYIGSCHPPFRIYGMLKEIQQNCFDLRGCSLDNANLRIRTGFSPLSRSDQRQWCPSELKDPPAWWSAIEHLPNQFEALLIIKR